MKSSLDRKRLSSKSDKLSTMASKVYKPSAHVLILITLPVRLQQRAGKKSQTSQRIIMRKIGFALALIVFTIFIQVRPRICNHLNYFICLSEQIPNLESTNLDLFSRYWIFVLICSNSSEINKLIFMKKNQDL